VRPAGANPRTVHFEIGRITMHGFSPAQQRRFLASLQASLAEWAASGVDGWPADGARRVGRLDAGALRPGASPEEAAARITTRLRAAVAVPRQRTQAR
jgi:hypothetical protein